MATRQRRFTFSLPEGEVTLSFPAKLSVGSARAMSERLKKMLERAKRQAAGNDFVRNEIDAGISEASRNRANDN
jgi:hypothetical protein